MVLIIHSICYYFLLLLIIIDIIIIIIIVWYTGFSLYWIREELFLESFL